MPMVTQLPPMRPDGVLNGLPIFGTTKTSAFLTNAQSRFASVVLDRVLGPSCLARQPPLPISWQGHNLC